MIYKMELSDSFDTMIFPLLEVPIEDKDVSGIASNTTIDGNVFNDYLWLKKQYVQKWSIMCQDEYNRLRGFWTRQFGNAEVPFYRLFYGENRYEDRNTFTVNGFVQIENDAPLYSPLSLTQLLGNATQKTLSGKNLLCNIPKSTPTTIGGVAFTIEDGVLKINGTTTGAGNFIFKTFQVATSGTYMLSVQVAGTMPNYTNAFIVEQNDSDISTGWTVVKTISPPGTTADMTLDSTKYYRFRWYINNSGVALNNCQIKAQLEAGSQPTAFEPYCGGVPMPNPQFPSDVNVVSGGQLVQVAGKNLFNFQEFAEAKTQPGGVSRGTATVSGNSITITATQYDAFTTYSFTNNVPPIFKVPKNTEMVLSWVSDNTTMAQKGMVYIFGMNESGGADVIKNAQDRANRVQFNTGKYDTISFRLGTTAVGDSITYSNIQLEYGMTPSEYEPYQSVQQYEVNLGKNLINISDLADANITVSNGVATGTGNQFYASYGQVSDGVPYIKEEGQLAVSFKAYTDGNVSTANTSGLVCRIVYTDGTNAVIIYCKNNETTAVLHKATTASGKNVASIELTYANDGGNIWHVSEFQIERGSVATSYAPYKTPIELAKIGNYTDGIKQVGDKWYIHKEIGKAIWDGSESWTTASNYCYHTESDAYVPASRDVVADILCDNFTPTSYLFATGTTLDYAIALDSNNAGRFALRHKDYLSASTLKTWLSTHNTTVYYALAIPTDTEITDSDLIEQLDFVASLYEGVNNLMLIPSAGAQGEIGVKYRLNYEQETDIVPKTPVVLTLTDGGVINACGCRQNIQLIMRETKESTES